MTDILLLEPNQVMARQYTAYLSDHGFRVSHLADAQAAIIAADTRRPDLIIMELLLAGHSGVEFLYELRSYSEWQSIPVIILSRISHADSNLDAKVMARMGIRAYLYKPETKLSRLLEVAEGLA